MYTNQGKSTRESSIEWRDIFLNRLHMPRYFQTGENKTKSTLKMILLQFLVSITNSHKATGFKK